MLGEDRRNKILQRVEPLLREIDPEVRLHEVLLDSTRQQLAFVLQKGEWPIVIGMNWLDYVSHRDEDLKQRLAESLQARLETARQRQAREEES
ncbi:MAG: hypothetical protein M1453_10675 [Acidobacteria bacterium]|nr:hypothetical protein [Acidobacteriota bacterium]MCL5288443.1 hypothetical protein [Acidobacteriota bacterium]